VIEEFVDTLVFLDGWQYSNGCAYEFLVANRTNPRPSLLKETLAPLALEEGIGLIHSAIADLESSKLPADFLHKVSHELAKPQPQEELLAQA
jgi:hypothetical protein